ncbi:MAG: hypothetical protein FJZ01_27100, partial [Candidatus Sericytochromatia bacterium]|nr:hypothetical protein [Candidatus Tanganyikabacteria bacterium]
PAAPLATIPAPLTPASAASAPVQPPPPPPTPPIAVARGPLTRAPGETPAPAFVVPEVTPPPAKLAEVLPPAPQAAQPGSYFPNPLGDGQPRAAAAQPSDQDTLKSAKDAYIRLKRKGMSVDVDTMLFPEDRDLFFQVAVPPLPSEAAAAQGGTGRGPAAGAQVDASTRGQFDSTNRSQSDSRFTQDSTAQHRINTDSTSQNTSRSQIESDSRARIDTTQRLEIKTENVPYPQPTPIVVFVTPPPTPAPPPGTVQKLFVAAQKLAYARRYDLALKELDKAMEIEPENAVLHALQGSVYYKAGAYDSARNSWYKALQLDPTMYDVRERLNLMSKQPQRGTN